MIYLLSTWAVCAAPVYGRLQIRGPCFFWWRFCWTGIQPACSCWNLDSRVPTGLSVRAVRAKLRSSWTSCCKTSDSCADIPALLPTAVGSQRHGLKRRVSPFVVHRCIQTARGSTLGAAVAATGTS